MGYKYVDHEKRAHIGMSVFYIAAFFLVLLPFGPPGFQHYHYYNPGTFQLLAALCVLALTVGVISALEASREARRLREYLVREGDPRGSDKSVSEKLWWQFFSPLLWIVPVGGYITYLIVSSCKTPCW